ncbi:MAG: hypothetical protein ACD_76C00097G0002 [uncultured bacterium]|nr:MAG: hypothetical protein ACD_76C00097G0002 [uncultured bacterium]HBD05704.1 hypothetical protein [Candidatus Uhrbacteria bacterium]
MPEEHDFTAPGYKEQVTKVGKEFASTHDEYQSAVIAVEELKVDNAKLESELGAIIEEIKSLQDESTDTESKRDVIETFLNRIRTIKEVLSNNNERLLQLDQFINNIGNKLDQIRLELKKLGVDMSEIEE